MQLPSVVKIVEVGPRDGLQNEPQFIPTLVKLELINRLTEAGFSSIEVTSFVSPKSIPQLADHSEVFKRISRKKGVEYPVLVPNLQGFEKALEAGVTEIAIFTAPSESFLKKNINCTMEESFKRFEAIVRVARDKNIKIRGYISCAISCPFEGRMNVSKVAEVAVRLKELGCYEISLGDTIGVGTPLQIQQLIEEVIKTIPLQMIAMHFHDTYGQALANVFASLQLGITTFDSSISGLGGCPYAPGATGNVATEDLLYLLNGLGIQTHIDLMKVIQAGVFISRSLNRLSRSKVSVATTAKYNEY